MACTEVERRRGLRVVLCGVVVVVVVLLLLLRRRPHRRTVQY